MIINVKRNTFILILLLLSLVSLFCQEKYPELPISYQYESVMNVILSGLLDDCTEDVKNELETKIKDHIFSIMPIEKFEEFIIGDIEILRKGNTDERIREKKEYKDSYSRIESLSRSMAIMVVSNSIDIYLCKYINTTEITQKLFDKSENNDSDQIISWIKEEIYDRNVIDKNNILNENDVIYYYISPPFSWDFNFGREGYAVFRDDKLLYNQLIMMN